MKSFLLTIPIILFVHNTDAQNIYTHIPEASTVFIKMPDKFAQLVPEIKARMHWQYANQEAEAAYSIRFNLDVIDAAHYRAWYYIYDHGRKVYTSPTVKHYGREEKTFTELIEKYIFH